MNRAVRKYLRQVKKRLYCPHSQRKEFLRQLEDELLLFCEAREKTDFSQLAAQFGPPEDAAENFFTELDAKAVSRFAYTRTRIAYLALAAAIAAALAGAGTSIQNYIKTQQIVTNSYASQTYTHTDGTECSIFWVRTQFRGKVGYWEYHSCRDTFFRANKPEWMDDATPYAVDVYVGSNGEVSHWRFGQEHDFWIKVYDT